MRKLMSLLIVFIIGCTFFMNTAYATKWIYEFVVYDGNVYVISETSVEPDSIGKKIGKVTKYSDMETYSGNFSNKYPKGTGYYEIKGVKVTDAIAVKESDGVFIKAVYKNKYQGSKDKDEYGWQDFIPYVIGIFLLGIIIYLVKRAVVDKKKDNKR